VARAMPKSRSMVSTISPCSAAQIMRAKSQRKPDPPRTSEELRRLAFQRPCPVGREIHVAQNLHTLARAVSTPLFPARSALNRPAGSGIWIGAGGGNCCSMGLKTAEYWSAFRPPPQKNGRKRTKRHEDSRKRHTCPEVGDWCLNCRRD
jgi:hypothetical protein